MVFGMHPERRKRILGLALPIIGGMASQNLFNLVDTAMVGTLGNSALAAVGLGGFVNFALAAPILGISVGVQAMAARRKGAGATERMAHPLNGALLVLVVTGSLMSAVWYQLVPVIFPYLNGDPGVIALGTPYLRIRVLALTFLGINFAFRGYWNAVDRSRLYLQTLLVVHATNITLNYLLIFGNGGFPEMGVEGAALASALATGLGTACYLLLGVRYARGHGFLKSFGSLGEVATLARLSLPAGLQQIFFSAGFTALYWMLGQVGTAELAAASVLFAVMLVAILPGVGFGLTAATLVGQALGRKEPADAMRWGWDVIKVGMVTLGVIGIPIWAAPEVVLSAFIHDAQTVALARLPMRLMGFLMAFDAVALILQNALMGAGDTRRVMQISVGMQWLVFLPLVYLAGPVLGFGLLAIWLIQGPTPDSYISVRHVSRL